MPVPVNPSLTAGRTEPYDRLSAENASDPAGLLRLENLALELGRDEETLIWPTQAVEAEPTSAPALVAKGRAQYRFGRIDNAIRTMAAAVAIDPDAEAALKRLRYLLSTDRLGAANALGRIARRGMAIGSVIDVGASNGQWSLNARSFWPDARFHLVEALHHWHADLESLCRSQSGFSYVAAAAGASEGEIHFFDDPEAPYGGAASELPLEGGWTVPQVSLTGEAKRLGLPGPYLIKLDTHGFEWKILEGAEPLFPDTALFVVESYIFRLHAAAALIGEMIAYMARHGFHPIDLSDPLWRPLDEAQWQLDFYFVRADRPEFRDIGYAG